MTLWAKLRIAMERLKLDSLLPSSSPADLSELYQALITCHHFFLTGMKWKSSSKFNSYNPLTKENIINSADWESGETVEVRLHLKAGRTEATIKLPHACKISHGLPVLKSRLQLQYTKEDFLRECLRISLAQIEFELRHDLWLL